MADLPHIFLQLFFGPGELWAFHLLFLSEMKLNREIESYFFVLNLSGEQFLLQMAVSFIAEVEFFLSFGTYSFHGLDIDNQSFFLDQEGMLGSFSFLELADSQQLMVFLSDLDHLFLLALQF
jgi:hypothetical protein